MHGYTKWNILDKPLVLIRIPVIYPNIFFLFCYIKAMFSDYSNEQYHFEYYHDKTQIMPYQLLFHKRNLAYETRNPPSLNMHIFDKQPWLQNNDDLDIWNEFVAEQKYMNSVVGCISGSFQSRIVLSTHLNDS